MKLFLYNQKNTLIHRLDPRTKLLALLCTFFLALLFPDIKYLAILTLLSLAVCLYARCLPQLKMLSLPLILLVITNIVMWSAVTKFSKEGTLHGVAMALRLSFMLLGGVTFLSTTRLEDIVSALLQLGVPYTISFSFSLALRLLPTFINTADIIIQAQKSRGLDLDVKNPVIRLKRQLPLLVPIFSCAFRQAESMSIALEARGFGGTEKKRTVYRRLTFAARDMVCIALLLVLIGLFIAVRLHLS